MFIIASVEKTAETQIIEAPPSRLDVITGSWQARAGAVLAGAIIGTLFVLELFPKEQGNQVIEVRAGVRKESSTDQTPIYTASSDYSPSSQKAVPTKERPQASSPVAQLPLPEETEVVYPDVPDTTTTPDETAP